MYDDVGKSSAIRMPAISITMTDQGWADIMNMFSMENKVCLLADNGQRVWFQHKD